ncbi:DUF1439 domain-containing protein [Thaumasiovibrio sp. DFM-14]|uniref:DUF1439 domain-containing protein n=1 Tax=Thaumasiovibrio sp. DFM-14 TaxID=3384792 RepID=UPI0039A0C848
MLRLLLTTSLFIFLNGCASYTVTENDIQRYLNDNTGFERSVGIEGIAVAHLTFDNVDVGIGRIASDRVNLETTAKASVEIMGLPNQQADIKVNMSAVPYYDKEEGAVFLNYLKLDDVDVNPDTFDIFSNSQPLMPLVTLVEQLLSTRPIYRLSDADFKQSLLKKSEPELQIINNKIKIHWQ